MEMVHVFTGLLLMVVGLLTRRYPWMINQWRYATEEERRNIDIKGLQMMYFGVLLVSGVLLMGVGVLNYFVKGSWSVYALLVVLLSMSGYMMYVQKRYDHNQSSSKKRVWSGVLLVVTVLLVIGVFCVGKQENRMELGAESLVIGGMYGEKIELSDIDTVYMSRLADLPNVEVRLNGYADGEVMKGYFRLTDWGKCKLLVHDVQGDVIVIVTRGRRFIVNQYASEGTAALYESVGKALGDR